MAVISNVISNGYKM